MRWVLWFLGHFNAKTPPQNTPFLALLQRNAKAQPTNYNNINALRFCILHFLQWMGVQTRQWLHYLKFFSFLRFFMMLWSKFNKKHDICLVYHKLFLSLPWIFKIRIFVVESTPKDYVQENDWGLWFALKFVSLWWNQHHSLRPHCGQMCCDLL